MKKLVPAALLAFTFGAADAQTAGSAKTTATATATAKLSSLTDVVASGLSVAYIAIVDGQEQVVATVKSDGTLQVEANADLSSATKVRISGAESSVTFDLASKVTKSGLSFVAYQDAQGKSVTLPLVAALNRTDAAERAATAKAAAEAKAAEAKAKAAATKPSTVGQPETTGAGASANGLSNTNATTGAENSAGGTEVAASGSGNATVTTPTAPTVPTPPVGTGRP